MSSREGNLFQRSLTRPTNYFQLSEQQQWRVDSELGILDWEGGCSHQSDINKCPACLVLYKTRFNLS